MKVVFISKEYPPSRHSYGIGTYTAETAQSLARLGHSVTVVCAADSENSQGEFVSEGVNVIRLPDRESYAPNFTTRVFGTRKVAEYRQRVADRLDILIHSGQADIVEFPGYRGESSLWHKSRTIPMVVRMHGFTGWVDTNRWGYLSGYRRQILRGETAELLNADLVTLPAEHIRASVEKRIPRQRVITLHNGIDAKHWGRSSNAGKLTDVTAEDILFVGTLCTNKGVFTLIDAAARLREQGTWKGRLILYGRSRDEFTKYISTHWRRNGLSSYIEIRGCIDRVLLPACYRNAGVCCFPSLNEPFGYTPLEASASGGVVIGSSGTGMADIIVDRETGFLIEPGDADRLSRVLELALNLSPAKRSEIQKAAEQRIVQEFDQDVITKSLIRIYEQVIKAFRHNPELCNTALNARSTAELSSTER